MQHTRKLQETSVSEIAGDRRRHRRYPLYLPLRFEGIHSGAGRTLDVSTSGLAIQIEDVIQPQTLIQFAVDWPVANPQSTPLGLSSSMELVVIGRVMRSDPASTSVEIISHHVRVLPVFPLHALQPTEFSALAVQ